MTQTRNWFHKHRTILVKTAVAAAWILGLALLIWLFFRYKDQVVPFLRQANLWLLAASFLGFFLSVLAVATGWGMILDSLSNTKTSWRVHFKIYVITMASRRLPGTLWYVGGRVAYYRRLGIPGSLVSIASGIELAVIIASGLFIGLLLLPSLLNTALGVQLGIAFLILALTVIFSPALIDLLLKLLRKGTPNKIRPLEIFSWMGVYSLVWLAGALMLLQIIRAFASLPAAEIPFVSGAWALAGSLGSLTVFLPSSFGVSEISLAFFLSEIMPASNAAVIAIVTRLIGIGFEILLSLVFYPFLRLDKL